ncbi:MAG: hypothetical protein PF487_02385 [Bacteroidales bacterium]|jgi:hypothetical protein|nr:hypothetical protein [Bacteroidales bacterium]
MKKISIVLFLIVLVFAQCTNQNNTKTNNGKNISDKIVNTTKKALIDKYGDEYEFMINKGVDHTSTLWRKSDGSTETFESFCLDNFIADANEKETVFFKISKNFESLWGHGNKISLDFQENIHLDNGPLHKVDGMFAAYSPNAHFSDDFYNNKIAFIISLNFPGYTLEEKSKYGKEWNKKQWAYARLGDVFTSRVPAKLKQDVSNAETNADMYISDYNIFMGHLLNNDGKKLFPDDMILLSHWNLRDEIKANYANHENGIEKQEMIYTVMKRIIDQTIPEKVINSGNYEWNPIENKVFDGEKEIEFATEPDTRYTQIINNFKALKALDKYHPVLDTYIKRKFSGEMEIPQAEVEELFTELLSSTEVKKVGKLISQRLGRDLKPYDIWYDGFKARSSISEEKLNSITEKRYLNAKALNDNLDELLMKLDWSKERAKWIASKISVDPARGSGHAWGAQMKSEKAHLRTRIPEKGMNYKGYNIAIHEFGHNVEQTISLHDVDYYMMNGVPNTAFTEALAFIFQKRDLQLLGIEDKNPNKEYLQILDNFWSVYEIMGVSMVDMNVWKWLYANPDATKAELKEAVISISKEIWNKYYADVFGSKDEPILAIYSHMISYPLYLSAYSFGHLIDFQVDQYLNGKVFADEVDKIWSQGKLIPQVWMKKAVGVKLSNKPILDATDDALKHIK